MKILEGIQRSLDEVTLEELSNSNQIKVLRDPPLGIQINRSVKVSSYIHSWSPPRYLSVSEQFCQRALKQEQPK